MRIFLRFGCIVLAVAATEGVSGAFCEEPEGEEELPLVPRGGGLFVMESWGTSCHMRMIGGGGWVPMRRWRGAPKSPQLYKPVRSLEPGVVYEVMAMRTPSPDEKDWCGDFGRAVAGAAADRRPPVWWLDPSVVSMRYRIGCPVHLIDEALVELAVPVTDDSPVRLVIEARPRDGQGSVMRAVERPVRGRARVAWPMRGERSLRAGAVYEVTICAHDAAGNRSCAPRPIVFEAPRRPVEPAAPGEVIEPTPAEPEQPVVLSRERVDRSRRWWFAGWPCLALLGVVIVVGLRRARLRRASRAV